jgi:uncharacterized integral membrane protein (TIGR00698 family)
LCLGPWGAPPIALALGVVLALTLGNPYPRGAARAGKSLLQVSVVGLGCGIPIARVVEAGSEGVVYTLAGIILALGLGWLLGRWLGVDGEISALITTGTSICGGSAIAAVGTAIRARHESMSVALGTVFVLNAVALYLFPLVGHGLDLSQRQFAVWAAVAIHDTSSVVGAAASYGAQALQEATVLKLARALWIVPLTVVAAAWRSRAGAGDTPDGAPSGSRAPIPWFIGAFLLAALARTVLPAAFLPAMDSVAAAARVGLVVTLFLIGTGLSRAALARVGARPLLQGLLLWILVGGSALAMVVVWV